MIQIEVKTFERKLDHENSEESRKLLEQDIHHFIAFFKENLIDYDIALDNYKLNHETHQVAVVVLRHKKVEDQSQW